ncbi:MULTISPECIES: helix-turn-helix domain-containing protein [unclassified Pseudomonas]|uniref:helix-turn-helix domain-containing protein n=1 Tax=unclassified Pseudomonas TaxID=196821 RepID=UPI00244BB997|nr:MULTISPECIES: helix-turn-helix domain-containing protein [unclassified Pseudomonas]MDH0302902.1 helix-turn-helix transcriptional regulator [Pseudomonas sp. GD04091]MDH1985493.1 helix-turn-helix transcriptional regulator [Pseudomonas sp. GD03689]
MSPHPFHPTHPPAATHAGEHLRRLRRQAGLSQLDLALLAGLSQRHLSCVETGRAKASPSTLHALLGALDVPLDHCNEVFLAAGYAPRYAASAPDAPALKMVHDAVAHILRANNPAPAIVITGDWDITTANASAGLLFAMAGIPAGSTQGLNLLDTLLRPGGLGDHLVNAQEIRAIAWQRATREAATNPALAHRLQGLPVAPALPPDTPLSPVVLTRVRTGDGELRFLSTFTTFGMPLDITVASLRIEHLVPADNQTWRTMTAAYDEWLARNTEPG